MKTVLRFKNEVLTNEEFGLEFDINLGKDFKNNDKYICILSNRRV